MSVCRYEADKRKETSACYLNPLGKGHVALTIGHDGVSPAVEVVEGDDVVVQAPCW